ncbi:ABC transporter permease [Actinomadura sp. 7K507]|uniref:ABC transporter permease n=1 Tax=Actinomadura sp. 7K507 TaxID=2530365 RepID=UPI00104A44A0|nr:ABC transporter permease [Actinomadura sp. 7K507]TDC88730.1 ABC transporter permease [Actinomadura sp. 7K507]
MAAETARPGTSGAPEGGLAAALLLPPAGVALLLLVWEAAPRLGLVRDTSVPPFSRVLAETGAVLTDPAFASEVGGSAYRWGLGFALAVLTGVPLGIVMARSSLVRRAVEPVLTMSYPVPKVALTLVLVLLFGAGTTARVIIVVLACLIPIVIASFHGAGAVPPQLAWSARGLGTSRAGVLVRVVLPAALPQVLSGMRMAIGVSIFALMAAELMIRQSGIGAYLFGYYDQGDTLRVWATATVIAGIGFLLDTAYVQAVRRALRWLDGEI